MLTEYIQAAMRKAKYEALENSEGYYGEIPGFRGVYAIVVVVMMLSVSVQTQTNTPAKEKTETSTGVLTKVRNRGKKK